MTQPTTDLKSSLSGGLPDRGILVISVVVFVLGLASSLLAGIVGAGQSLSLGLLTGVMTAAIGSISWWMILRRTFSRSGSVFLGGVFGGLALRMFLYGVVIVVTALTGTFSIGALLAALFASHVAYQVLEVAGLHRARGSGGHQGTAAAAFLLLAAGLLVAPAVAAQGPEVASTEVMDEAQAGHGEQAEASHENASHQATEGEFDLLHHIVNGHELETPFGVVNLPQGWIVGGIDMSPTKHVVWVWISGAIMFLVVMVGVRQVGLIPRGLGNVLEALVAFVRDELAGKNIQTNPEKFTPYLCTLFMFILFANLAGLIPYGVTATSNLNVTAGLAILSLVLIQASGVRENGLVGHVKALCPIPQGIPGWILPLYVPIIIVVELVGVVAKPIALTLRLFANMVAGHVVILSLLGLIFILKTVYVAPASVAFALFIYCLEIFVAFIQAYIFTMLTALFIGMSQHPAH